MAEGKKLVFQLTDQQLSALKPLLEQTGKIKLAGEVEGDKLSVSFLACNMAFMACNAAFVACNSPFRVETKK